MQTITLTIEEYSADLLKMHTLGVDLGKAMRFIPLAAPVFFECEKCGIKFENAQNCPNSKCGFEAAPF